MIIRLTESRAVITRMPQSRGRIRSLTSVSYTHLDVYKRQGYHRYTSVGEDREAESRLKWTVWDFSAAGVTFRTIIGRGGRFALLGYAPGEADGAPLYPAYVRAEGETDTVLASARCV